MRELPLAHPGTPDLRSPTRFLVWVARGQLGTLALGILYGVVWMAALAVVPALVGRAIDLGVAEGDTAGLLRWSALILAAGLVSAIAGILRHRVAVVNWLTATYRVQQLLVRQAVRLGASPAGSPPARSRPSDPTTPSASERPWTSWPGCPVRWSPSWWWRR
jgi:ABC-type multidrug transport system fused ATPase/permease subunit